MKQIIFLAIFAFGCNAFGNRVSPNSPGFNPMTHGSGPAFSNPADFIQIGNPADFLKAIKEQEKIAKQASQVAIRAYQSNAVTEANQHREVASDAADKASRIYDSLELSIKTNTEILKKMRSQRAQAATAAGRAAAAAGRAAAAAAQHSASKARGNQ